MAKEMSYRVLARSGHDPELKSYKSMIYSDFMKSLRFGNDWYSLIDSDRYYAVYTHIIDQLLSRRDSIVRLAVLEDDLDVCLGWSLSENKKLHYVYVKEDYRCQGIGASLMPDKFDTVTHLTKIGQSIRKKKFPNAIFDPFI